MITRIQETWEYQVRGGIPWALVHYVETKVNGKWLRLKKVDNRLDGEHFRAVVRKIREPDYNAVRLQARRQRRPR